MKLEQGMAQKSSSLAMKAFQLSMAAAQESPAIDYWDYLEHIEAPQWVDLSLEASLEGTEGDDPWFYQHHPHHETPLEELVFTPKRETKLRDTKKRDEHSPKSIEYSPVEDQYVEKASSSVEKTNPDIQHRHGELNKPGNAQVWPRSKAKRVQLLPDSGTRNESGKQEYRDENHVGFPLRPSEAFSTKLLSTLMARLRTSEERRASPDSAKDTLLTESEVMDTNAENTYGEGVQKHGIRRSIACVPLTEQTQHVKRNKENTNTKKPKTMGMRKSIATFEFVKSSTFSVGRSDTVTISRRRLSCCKSPRLKNKGKSFKTSNDRRMRASSDVKSSKVANGLCKAKACGDDLAALIAKHNSKFQAKPKYEPRLHSTRDIREWERRTGQQYYELQPIERVRVNQEITDYKRSQVQ